MQKYILIIAIAAGAWYQLAPPAWIDLDSPLAHAVTFSAGETAMSRNPVQKDITRKKLSFNFKEFHIQALASFETRARVLSRKDYRSGREAELSPIDLALGWGPMSRDDVIEKIDISQRGRFYYWRVEKPPIPFDEIVSNSANMHLIPGNRQVEQQLRQVSAGDTISLRGYLVRIDADDGWHWKSSLTRKDSGAGACEVVLVESIGQG